MIHIGTYPISCFVFDLDGTVYCENSLINDVVPFFTELNSLQTPFYFFTNNSSHSKDFYLKKLRGFGLSFIEKQQIISSTDVLISYLNSKKISQIACIGTDDMQQELQTAGISIVSEKNKSVEAVIIGFDTSLNYEKIELANHYARKGVPIFATNEDVLCPASHNEFIPDCGAITALIETSSGHSAHFFGKPQKVAADYICNYTKIQAEQICMVGDRLYTDMKMAQHNFKTILVLSGETTEDMARTTKQHVDYIISDITNMQELFFSKKGISI